MTRERLVSLSRRSLLEIGRKTGIRSADDYTDDDLIDYILEALEEDRMEKHLLNNPAMNVEETKYDITRDEELPGDEDELELPEYLTENRLVVMLRDPFWAYAYWDLKKQEKAAFKADPSFKTLCLRVYNLGNESDCYDIPVGIEDTSWYINLPETNTSYRFELVQITKHAEFVVVQSNEIFSPQSAPEIHEGNAFQVLMVSGIFDSGDSSFSDQIPQRVLQIEDVKILNK
jgi:hypothetical protein